MKKQILDLLKQHNATYSDISKWKHCVSNNHCKIDFLKERYEDGFVIVIETPVRVINLVELVKKSKDFPDRTLFKGDSNNLEDVIEFTIAECSDILQGDYSRLQP